MGRVPASGTHTFSIECRVLVVLTTSILKCSLNFYWAFYDTKICKLMLHLDLSGTSAPIALKYY
jgi:hypothetical protein